MTDYTKLLIGENGPHRIDAVIKILKDSVNKHEYRKQFHVFRFDRALFSPRALSRRLWQKPKGQELALA